LLKNSTQTATSSLDLFEAIQALKQELNGNSGTLLPRAGHSRYRRYIGDSGLSRQAANTDADVIVFAGVHFMAETAKILNPNKLVLLPDLAAGCSLADSCPPTFAAFKAHPDHLVISYINCTAEIKAMSDIICTSSNAVHIVRQIRRSSRLFLPGSEFGAICNGADWTRLGAVASSCIVHETFRRRRLSS